MVCGNSSTGLNDPTSPRLPPTRLPFRKQSPGERTCGPSRVGAGPVGGLVLLRPNRHTNDNSTHNTKCTYINSVITLQLVMIIIAAVIIVMMQSMFILTTRVLIISLSIIVE